MALNIFEPRYRLLVRRAMEGNRRFGMAQVRHASHYHNAFVVLALASSQNQLYACSVMGGDPRVETMCLSFPT